MNAIKITVEKKIASVEGLPEIVCGNSGYTLSFAFDNEWSDEQNKVARFSFNKNNKKCFIDMPIENNTCQVPVLVGIALVRVGVYAGELKTTTGAKIKCIKSIICDDAEATEEGMQNLYEKLQGQIKEIDEKTIQHVDSVNLSTCASGVYFTDTIIYKTLIPQPMTEKMPCKALLTVEKTQFGTHFFWLSDACFIAGMSNENGRFESDFVRYSLEDINNAIKKTDVETEVSFDLNEGHIYNVKAINDAFMIFNETLTNLDERIGAIEEDYAQALSLIGGAE
jgi:hypothetical protein